MSSHQTHLEFWIPDTKETVEVTFDVDVEISSTEYADGYLFYEGGVSIWNYQAQPFVWKEKLYNAIQLDMLEHYANLAVDEEELLDRALRGDGEAYDKLIAGWLNNDLDRHEYAIPSYNFKLLGR